jgi:hypothetical protein
LSESVVKPPGAHRVHLNISAGSCNLTRELARRV